MLLTTGYDIEGTERDFWSSNVVDTYVFYDEITGHKMTGVLLEDGTRLFDKGERLYKSLVEDFRKERGDAR